MFELLPPPPSFLFLKSAWGGLGRNSCGFEESKIELCIFTSPASPFAAHKVSIARSISVKCFSVYREGASFFRAVDLMHLDPP